MKKVVRKFFFVWNEDKEKRFLERMAGDGWRLTGVGFGRYEFEAAVPERVAYQFDFKVLGKAAEADYLQLFEDDGWRLSARFGPWYYFSRALAAGERDASIYSDNQSRLAKYRRLLLFLVIVGLPLYYQAFFQFPGISGSDAGFPGFYFFFRIFVFVLTGLHALALVRVLFLFRKMKSSISE